MARNYIKLSELINNYKTAQDESDYDKYASIPQLRDAAFSVLKELSPQFSMGFKAVRLDVNTNNYTVNLPNDFLKETLVSVLDTKTCTLIPLGKKDKINVSGDILKDSSGESLLDSDGIELLSNTICTPSNNSDYFYDYPYLYQRWVNPSLGRQYGQGGGNNAFGYYRFNPQDNYFNLELSKSIDKIVLEYQADVTMQGDPDVDSLLEDAIGDGIYYRLIRRKNNVPANEKERAKREWNNSLRLAKRQLNSLSKSEWLQQFRKNTQSVPIY